MKKSNNIDVIDYKKVLSDKIISLQNKTNDQLREFNYTDEQIYAIRNFDGSDKMLRLASSYCEVYGGFTNVNITSTSTSAQMVTAFRWHGQCIPGLFGTQDILAVTWCSPLVEKSRTGTVAYGSINRSATVKATGLYASNMVFKNNLLTIDNGSPNGNWVTAGSIISQLSSGTRVPDLVAYAAYGSNSLITTPSVSIGSGGVGADLSFSGGVTEIASDRFYY